MKLFARILWIVMIIIVFGTGFYIAYGIFNKKEDENKFVALPQTMVVEEDKLSKKLRLEQAVADSFQSKKELITYEVALSQIIEWDDSWGKFDIFHKSQRIRFFGNGIYVNDLESVTKDNIMLDIEEKTAIITVSKPTIKSITIDESKTEYEDVKTGWLRFGSLSLSPDDYNTAYSFVKEQMQAEMESYDVYSAAEQSSMQSLHEIFQSILDAIDSGYTVSIVFAPSELIKPSQL